MVTATTSEDGLSGYPDGCIRLNVNLECESSHEKVPVEFAEEPINQAQKICRNTPNVVRKWTLEKPAVWKR